MTCTPGGDLIEHGYLCAEVSHGWSYGRNRGTGRFVLITNELFSEDGGLSSKDLLKLYKDQHSIE